MRLITGGLDRITIHDLALSQDFHLTGARRRQEDVRHRHRYDEVTPTQTTT
jgi:hypothetical protein